MVFGVSMRYSVEKFTDTRIYLFSSYVSSHFCLQMHRLRMDLFYCKEQTEGVIHYIGHCNQCLTFRRLMGGGMLGGDLLHREMCM